jgi:hypothetical protein
MLYITTLSCFSFQTSIVAYLPGESIPSTLKVKKKALAGADCGKQLDKTLKLSKMDMNKYYSHRKE